MLKGTPEPQDTNEFLLFDLLPDCWQCSPLQMHLAASIVSFVCTLLSVLSMKLKKLSAYINLNLGPQAVLFLRGCLVFFFLSDFDLCS